MIDALITRLKSNAPLLGERVEGAASLSAFMASKEYPQTTPAAWVIPLTLGGGEAASSTGAHRQMLTRTIGVLWVVGYAGTVAGGELTADLAAIEAKIIAALAGFVPVAGQGALRLVRSGIDAQEDGFFFWQTEFAFTYQLRITS